MKVRILCPECETTDRIAIPGQTLWRCPHCDHVVKLASSGAGTCAVCSNADLFRKKDFPHALGMGILIAAFVTSTLTYWLYDKWLTWAILIGSAAFDGILYLLVKDVVVCYRCHSEFRGIDHPEQVAPFELTTHERYRQERLRKQEMQRTGQ